MEDCLYNVYETSRDRIEDELIASIVRGFLENPTESKYRNLREKIFSEHKEEIMKTLADSAIEDTIKMMVRERTIRFSSFDWDWKTFLVKFIFENWNVFKDDEIIKEQFGKRIEELEHVIDCLEHKLSKATRILEE